MTKFLIYRGDRISESALTLRDAMRSEGIAANVNTRGSTRRFRRPVINWGSSNLSLSSRGRLINNPTAVGVAINKLEALTELEAEGVRVPKFSTNIGDLDRSGIVIARTVLDSSSGRGIVVLRSDDDVVPASLYVQYVPKLVEYRVHVAFGKAIFAQQKRKREGVEQDRDQKLIRNYGNGWVFCPADREALTLDTTYGNAMLDEAEAAVKALGLDFGAVDIIIGKDNDLPYVLEVNTAPGLESPGLIAAYVNAFRSYMRQ